MRLNARDTTYCKSFLGKTVTVIKDKIPKCEREVRVKLLNLRGKTNVYKIQFLNSEIIQ